MKTRSIILFIALLVLMPGVSKAQFGVVRRAINRQVDHKIDSSIEKSAQDERDKKAKEEAEGNKTGNTGENSASKSKSVGLFGGKIDIKYKDNYDFTGRIYMQMETYDKKDVLKSDFYTYFNTNALDAGVELKTTDPKDEKTVISTVFLFDNENRAFMSLFSMESKMGTISSIPSDSALAAQAKTNAEKTKQPVVTKTGNSRVVAGYKCDEYKVVDPEKAGYSLVWMTKDFKVKADRRYWGKSGMPSYYNYPGFEGMVMLAMQEFDKENTLAIKMETIEVNENYKKSFSTVGYKFTKVNFGMGGKSGKK
ncbi:MAG: DUF4412 domain-containing protein [Bacteroidales bacterium]|nr:DUF4412 domain-containing protein [Bacteroidales bacterium]